MILMLWILGLNPLAGNKLSAGLYQLVALNCC